MPLPPFNSQGLLPEGLHSATEDDLRERCVAPFPESQTRGSIFSGLCEYRQRLTDLGVTSSQWIDGSFVDASRLDPGDVDLVNFQAGTLLNSVPSESRAEVLSLLTGIPSLKARYQVHAFTVIMFPPDHRYAQRSDDRLRYWTALFTTPQRYGANGSKSPAPERGRKGIALMTVGDGTVAPSTNLME